MGILQHTISGRSLPSDMTFTNFLSASMLWDEAMATSASSWSRSNPTGLFVAVVGNGHVKFGCGAPARAARMLKEEGAVRAVMINSRAEDTGPQSTDGRTFMLGLRYASGGGVDDDAEGRTETSTAAADDVRQAVTMGQASEGSTVLPLADLLWYSPGAVEKVGIFA